MRIRLFPATGLPKNVSPKSLLRIKQDVSYVVDRSKAHGAAKTTLRQLDGDGGTNEYGRRGMSTGTAGAINSSARSADSNVALVHCIPCGYGDRLSEGFADWGRATSTAGAQQAALSVGAAGHRCCRLPSLSAIFICSSLLPRKPSNPLRRSLHARSSTCCAQGRPPRLPSPQLKPLHLRTARLQKYQEQQVARTTSCPEQRCQVTRRVWAVGARCPALTGGFIPSINRSQSGKDFWAAVHLASWAVMPTTPTAAGSQRRPCCSAHLPHLLGPGRQQPRRTPDCAVPLQRLHAARAPGLPGRVAGLTTDTRALRDLQSTSQRFLRRHRPAGRQRAHSLAGA